MGNFGCGVFNGRCHKDCSLLQEKKKKKKRKYHVTDRLKDFPGLRARLLLMRLNIMKSCKWVSCSFKTSEQQVPQFQTT